MELRLIAADHIYQSFWCCWHSAFSVSCSLTGVNKWSRVSLTLPKCMCFHSDDVGCKRMCSCLFCKHCTDISLHLKPDGLKTLQNQIFQVFNKWFLFFKSYTQNKTFTLTVWWLKTSSFHFGQNDTAGKLNTFLFPRPNVTATVFRIPALVPLHMTNYPRAQRFILLSLLKLQWALYLHDRSAAA